MNTWLCISIVLALCTLASAAHEPAPPSAVASDETMYDCNDNGVEDAVDIAIGSSSDNDHDGIPDECQARGAD